MDGKSRQLRYINLQTYHETNLLLAVIHPYKVKIALKSWMIHIMVFKPHCGAPVDCFQQKTIFADCSSSLKILYIKGLWVRAFTVGLYAFIDFVSQF